MADENEGQPEGPGCNVSQGTGVRPENVPFSQPVINAMMMPWFMGVPWIPRFNGDSSKMNFSEWSGQVQAMLRAQGLNEEQKIDFIYGALEGEAKREMKLLNPGRRLTSVDLLSELKRLYGRVTPVAQIRAQFFKCHQQEEETVSAFILRLRELFSTWREQEPAGSAQDEMTIRDQLVLGLRPGVVQQELQRQVRRKPTLSFTEVCSEVRALEVELKMEPVCASRIFVPQTNQSMVAPSLEEWRETVRAELRKEITDQLSVIKETLTDEIKRQLSPQTWVHRDPSLSPGGAVQEGRYASSTRRHQTLEWDERGKPICRGCGKAGHIQRYCQQGRRQLN